jgi:ribose 1,5-bisphosphokinase PhnN
MLIKQNILHLNKMVAEKKVIAVVGGTGAQGGSLVRAILKENSNASFVARVLTRDPSKVREEEIPTTAATYSSLPSNAHVLMLT